MATSHNENTHTQGSVKDPEHDGRLKENREAGHTKGTTEASAERSHGHPQESQGGKGQESKSHESRGHESKSHESQSNAKGSSKSEDEGSDLKSREYTDKDGKVHHHTHTAGQSK